MNKKIILPVLAISTLAIAGSLWLGVNNAKAAGQPSTMIDRLAEKLGVDKTKVQSVFDETRADRQKEMQTNKDAKLSEAVSAGVITEAQKAQIIAKQSEFQAMMQEQRQAHQDEMDKWMTEQGIDHDKLEPYMRGGKGGHRGMGGKNNPVSATNQAS